MDVDRVFNQQKKRFFVLYPETAEVVMYRDKRKGQAIDRLGAVQLTGDTAISVEDRSLFVVRVVSHAPRGPWWEPGRRVASLLTSALFWCAEPHPCSLVACLGDA